MTEKLSSGEDLTERAVAWLRADAQRLDRSLTREEIEQVASALKLSTGQITDLFDALEVEGIYSAETIPIDDIEEDVKNYSDDVLSSTHRLMASAFKYPLLTADEERVLGRKIALGAGVPLDSTCPGERALAKEAEQARSRLALSNVRLVASLARFYATVCDEPIEDLFQDGIAGLLRACDKFDTNMGFRFTTYAIWWIRQSITRAIADRGRTIRLPVHAFQDMLRYLRAVRLLKLENHEKMPSDYQISEELGWNIEKAHYYRQLALLEPLSLDQPIGSDDTKIADTLSSSDQPEYEVWIREREQLIQHFIQQLDHKAALVITRRYGFHNGSDGETLEEIGKQLGISRERIRQIQELGLNKLRRKMNAAGLTREDLDGQ